MSAAGENFAAGIVWSLAWEPSPIPVPLSGVVAGAWLVVHCAPERTHMPPIDRLATAYSALAQGDTLFYFPLLALVPRLRHVEPPAPDRGHRTGRTALPNALGSATPSALPGLAVSSPSRL